MNQRKKNMKFLKTNILITLFVILLYGTLHVEGNEEIWIKNLDEAIAKAKEVNKYLLVNFSGSDWCGWCMKFDEHIASKKEFQKAATKDFVLCVIDWRRKSPMPKEEEKHVVATKEKYGIQGFPTILIMDKTGFPLFQLQTSYQDGIDGVLKKMKEGLDQAKNIEENLKIIDSTENKDAHIHASKIILENMGSYAFFYTKYLDTMLTLDKDNKEGLAEKVYIRKIESLRTVERKNLKKSIDLAKKIIALPNVSDETQKIAYLYLAVMLKQDDKKEEAIKAAENVKGLQIFRGRPFHYDKFMSYINTDN